MKLSPKQKVFWNEPYHRYNIKYGAARSGKTYLDFFIIPRRVRERHGWDGQLVLLGNSKGTLQRNVIEPMQAIYGPRLVSSIKSDNTAWMFGERVHCLGADNAARVDKIRGMSIKYVYGDEITTWNEGVFQMLKSRLDKPYSCMDATCNPKDPEHWVKLFIDDADVDVFSQQYSLDDNPFLDAAVRESLKRELRGVFYDRYIEGLWTVAEGLVFPYFDEEKDRWISDIILDKGAVVWRDKPLQITRICIGIDFGETGSMTTMHATGFVDGYSGLIVLEEGERKRTERLDTEEIATACADFCEMVHARYGRYDFVFGDSAAPALINRVAALLRERGLPWRTVAGCYKTPLESRPVTVDGLLGANRLMISRRCKGLIKALSQLRWDEKDKGVPEDKNLGSINDYWDSYNYSFSAWAQYFDRRIKG